MKRSVFVATALSLAAGTVMAATCDWSILQTSCPLGGQTASCVNCVDPDDGDCAQSGGNKIVSVYTVNLCHFTQGSGPYDHCGNHASPPQDCYEYNVCNVMSTTPCPGQPGKVLCKTATEPILLKATKRSPDFSLCL